jgi:FkbM family methyltransferase
VPLLGARADSWLSKRKVLPVPAIQAQDLKVYLTRFPKLYAASRRPYATARYLLRRPHDLDYAAFGLFPQTDGLFLDVGANAGMSAMSLRIYQRRARIMAIEPNPFHEGDLRWAGRVVGRFQYAICAAGDVAGEAELFVPVYRGVPFTTEASLTRDAVRDSPSLKAQLGPRMSSPDFRIERVPVEVRRIDDLRLAPSFVKLDVQGHEQAVLSGMQQTLEAYGPPVMVEGPSEHTMSYMASLGYRPYAFDHETKRLVPLAGHRTNVMFVRKDAEGSL